MENHICKQKIFLFLFLLFFSINSFAQSPQQLKQDAITTLLNIQTNDPIVQRDITRACSFIEKSLTFRDASLFIDGFRISAKDGRRVFQNSRVAVITLFASIAKKTTPQPIKDIFQQVVDSLVLSDKKIAELSLQTAQTMVGVFKINASFLGLAVDRLTRGKQDIDPRRAISFFDQSWLFSQRTVFNSLRNLTIVDFANSPDSFNPINEQSTLDATIRLERLAPGQFLDFTQAIKNSSGNLVRTIVTKNQVVSNSVDIKVKSIWDGRDDQGNIVAPGNYTFVAYAQLFILRKGLPLVRELSFPVLGAVTVAIPAPEIISIDPRVGDIAGGTPVTIFGSNLENVTKVFFGTNEASNIVANGNQVICSTPPVVSASTVDVVVEDFIEQRATIENAFTYTQLPGNLFTDITSTNFPGTKGTAGNTFFDVDGDGDLDNVDAKASFLGNNVFLNDGSGTFSLAPNNAGIPTNSEGHSIIPGDIDNDGDMDLAVGWFFVGGSKVFQNNNAVFTDVSNASGVGNPRRIHGGALADVDNDNDLDLSFAVDGANLLYINDGSGNFNEQGKNRGVALTGFGISTVFADIDNDGDLDLLTTTVQVTNGTKILQNDGNGNFQDITTSSGIVSTTSETCCFGDIDNDGDLDLYQGGIAVYKNDGNGFFEDITTQTGIVPANVSLRNCMWVDVNNDGHLDLWENGTLWLNLGNLNFIDATNDSGLRNLGNQQNACFGDIDGDGDLDLKTSNLLFRNNSNNTNFLIVRANSKLNSVSHNAKVFVYEQGQLGNNEHLLGYREIIMSTIRLSGSTPYAHFGLSNNEIVDVRVIFLDGTVKDLQNVERGTTITVLKDDNSE